ncbi:MAG: hypothetical protein QXV17_09890 [Candidatus Micrarchaeaceae archaeon]
MKSLTPREFSPLPSFDFGMAYASMEIMKSSGILQPLKKYSGVYAHILIFMIISRLVKLSFYQ